MPGHDIRLIDEDGNEVPPGEIGEVVGRSPAMMIGYHNQPGKTAEAEWFDAERQALHPHRRRRPLRRGRLPDADGPQEGHDHHRRLQHLSERPRGGAARASGGGRRGRGRRAVRGSGARRRSAFVRAAHGRRCERRRRSCAWANGSSARRSGSSALHSIDELPRSAIGKVLKRELRDRLASDRMTPIREILAAATPIESGFRATIPGDWLQGRTAYGGLSSALALHAAAVASSRPAATPLGASVASSGRWRARSP